MTIEEEIFNTWIQVMAKSRAKLTPNRKAKIKARLKEGYTRDDIELAIMGCRASGFHMGDNPGRVKYNDIELICRSGEKLESFMDRTEQAEAGQFSATTAKNITNIQDWLDD